MTQLSFPVLYLNFAGEMIYVVENRLKAQQVPANKSSLILHQLGATMFNGKFIQEIMRPQSIYSNGSMKSLFQRLVHSSIMKLNSVSMEKLFDLMCMAVKYQIVSVTSPREILFVTLNHFDSIIRYMTKQSAARLSIEAAMDRFIKEYAELSATTWNQIRQTLLNYFQDCHIRITIFLNSGLQTNDGYFVIEFDNFLPPNFVQPGQIQYFDAKGNRQSADNFQKTKSQKNKVRTGIVGSLAINGDRGTDLGLNVYLKMKNPKAATENVSIVKQSVPTSDLETQKHDPRSMAQFELLTKLIKASSESNALHSHEGSNAFMLNLFEEDDNQQHRAAPPPSSLHRIQRGAAGEDSSSDEDGTARPHQTTNWRSAAASSHQSAPPDKSVVKIQPKPNRNDHLSKVRSEMMTNEPAGKPSKSRASGNNAADRDLLDLMDDLDM